MIWNSIASLFGRAARHVRAVAFGAAAPAAVSVQEARQNPTVFAAVKLIANTVSKLPLQAPSNAQINRVLQHPNALQNGATFHADVVTDLLYHGNALIEIKRGATGSLLALYPHSPEPAPTIEADNGTVTYTLSGGLKYRNRRSGATRSYELIHVRDGGGYAPWSQSRISGVGAAIRAAIEADKRIADIFKNGLAVSYFFSNRGKWLKDEEQDRLEKNMQQYTGADEATGRGKRGGYAYIGDLEVTPVKGITPADSDMRGLRSDLKLEISAGFGVPPFRAGGDANTKYSNASAANAALIRDEILSLVGNVTATFTEALGVPITCDTSRLIKGDLMDQIKAAVAARGGPVADLDEGRELADLPKANAAQRAEILKMGKGQSLPPDREGERRDIPEEQQ